MRLAFHQEWISPVLTLQGQRSPDSEKGKDNLERGVRERAVLLRASCMGMQVTFQAEILLESLEVLHFFLLNFSLTLFLSI